MSNADAGNPPSELKHSDRLGCCSSGLLKDFELETGGLRLYRKATCDHRLDRILMPGSDRGYLIGISLAGGHQRKVLAGRRTTSVLYDAQTVYVRDLSQDYRADVYGDFDFVLAELPNTLIEQLSDGRSSTLASALACTHAATDGRLIQFARALDPFFGHHANTDALCLEQLGIAIATHIVEHYGSSARARSHARRCLSDAHFDMAREMLMSKGERPTSLSEIASACGLSRSYFIRAFCEAAGCTPHQWLIEQRVSRARTLLKSSALELSEIALVCGFADQSHFSRVFSKVTGTPPGSWRRDAKRHGSVLN